MHAHFTIKEKNGKKYFYRFSFNQRFQHIILFSSVITLVLTGMPLKYYDAPWAKPIYALFGGIEATPVVHKTVGVILLLLFAYHLCYLLYDFCSKEVAPMIAAQAFSIRHLIERVAKQPMMPHLKDLKDILQLMKYLLFLSSERPRGDRFTWKEKFDYWAPFWGIVIIGSSGLIRWQKEWVSQYLSGEIINYAVIAHGDEALLAALFLFIWHFYNVHYSKPVFPMGTVFLTGYLSEELMIHEHYDHYVEIMTKEGREDEIRPMPGGRDAGHPGESKAETVAEVVRIQRDADANAPQDNKTLPSDLPRS
ncbi:MAG: hypothetical protein P8X96_07705 [Desulfobacteraceae bacterium]